LKLGRSKTRKKFMMSAETLLANIINHIPYTDKMQLSEESKVHPVPRCPVSISNNRHRSALRRLSTSLGSQSTSTSPNLSHLLCMNLTLDSGYVPLILWLGYTRSVPRPSLIKCAISIHYA
jgi:hypothetical protein